MNTKSLNTIATFIAGRFNDANNDYFKQEIKFALNYWRALLFKRSFDKRGDIGLYAQNFTAELEVITEDVSCHALIVGDCKISRTKKTVPLPIAKNTSNHFQYVGNKYYTQQFQEQYPETLTTSLYDRFIGKKIKYYYNEGHIYVYGNKYLKYISVRDMWENPQDLLSLCVDSANCFTDDEPYPIPLDMLQTIVTNMLSGEFAITKINDQEITINDVRDS